MQSFPSRAMAARMLRLNERQPDPEATWKALTRAERKRARNLWDFALDAGFDSAPQGRPFVIDSALVLYCSRVIAEACGKPKFQFSRPIMAGLRVALCGKPSWPLCRSQNHFC